MYSLRLGISNARLLCLEEHKGLIQYDKVLRRKRIRLETDLEGGRDRTGSSESIESSTETLHKRLESRP